MVRAFIGIRPPSEVVRSLGEWSERLHARWPTGSVRWVAQENVHLTLRFLGDCDEQMLDKLPHVLGELGRRRAPFTLRVAALGAFPTMRNPRVLWLGLAGDLDALLTLQELLEESVQEMGFLAEERPFLPHLTLGRVRQGQRAPAGDWAWGPPARSFIVSEIELIESRLHKRGAEYRTLGRVALG